MVSGVNQSRRVTRDTIGQFAELTGDFSRIHLDQQYAHSLGLQDNFAHGLLGASWAAGWLSQQQTRDGSATATPAAIEFNFGTPVFCGDELSLQADPTEASAGGVDNAWAFSLTNQEGDVTSHGKIEFSSLDNLSTQQKPALITPDAFTPDETKVYYAADMFRDGPRGTCPCLPFEIAEVTEYLQFTGESGAGYRGANGELIYVPPVLLFCRAFSTWLEKFLCVETPDSGFPGHIKDEFRQHRWVAIGEALSIRHQVTAHRLSKSRPDMALITITLQVCNQQQELIQSGSVLLLMQDC